jgi:hypothetical protein
VPYKTALRLGPYRKKTRVPFKISRTFSPIPAQNSWFLHRLEKKVVHLPSEKGRWPTFKTRVVGAEGSLTVLAHYLSCRLASLPMSLSCIFCTTLNSRDSGKSVSSTSCSGRASAGSIVLSDERPTSIEIALMFFVRSLGWGTNSSSACSDWTVKPSTRCWDSSVCSWRVTTSRQRGVLAHL